MKRRSLVLITVDCLRADHVGFLGYSRPVTPFLDYVAETGVVFSDAVVAGAPTYFSFPSIMASRYPLALGRDVIGIAPDEPTLATALQDAGYATAAFVAGNPYLSPRFGYNQGFDSFRDFLSSESGGEAVSITPSARSWFSDLNRFLHRGTRQNATTAALYDELYFWYCQLLARRANTSTDTLRRYPAADVLVDQACSWLSTVKEEPFFLWLHLMDPHHPYYPPEAALAALGYSHIGAHRARFLNAFWNRFDIDAERLKRYVPEIISLYDAGVYWADKQIQRLVQTLQQSHQWDETVLAVTADHGEGFLEHGERYHSPTSLPEELIHVPLVIRVPEVSSKVISRGPFSLIHLAPTLLQMVGVPVSTTFRGRGCMEKIQSGTEAIEPAIVECVEACNNPFQRDDRMRPRLMAVRDHAYKLVFNFRENVDYLYDLKNDPCEHSPVPQSMLVSERARLLRVFRAHFQNLNDSGSADLRLGARLREVQQSAALIRHPAGRSQDEHPTLQDQSVA